MNDKPQTYERWLYDEKARLALVNIVREAVAELRHTKEPNKRLATLVQKKLDNLPKELAEGQISVSRWARLSREFGLVTFSVNEKRCYKDGEFSARYEDTHIHLCWNQNHNTWEQVEKEIDREDPSDTLERIEQEQEIVLRDTLRHLDWEIEVLQIQINGKRELANGYIALLPIPKAATLRIESFFWERPTEWAKHEFPHIWPEK